MGYQVELATLLHAEKEGRVRSWEAYSPTANYGKDSVSARDRTAEFSVMNLTLDIIDIKGEIAAIETEREYLTLLLSYTTED